MRNVSLAIIILSFLSCGNTEKKENKVEIGKYLYLDKDSTLHINMKCIKFIVGEDKDFGVKRISSETIPPEYLDKSCSYCVSDEAYEDLKSRVDSSYMDLGLE